MNSLAELIDQISPPEIPDSISGNERELILLLLESAKQQVRPYTGDFRAPWLLVPFEADVWETTNRGREEWIDGQWKGTIRVDWRVCLSNAYTLTNPAYEKLLTAVKKVAFLMRSDLICGSSGPLPWLRMCQTMLIMVRWVVLNEARFRPEVHGLSLVDQAALDWLFMDAAKGGAGQLLRLPQRCLIALYKSTHGTACPQALLDNPYALSDSEIAPIVRWIESQGGYLHTKVGPHREKRVMSHEWLGRLINEHPNSFISPQQKRFARQFEPDFHGTPLLVSGKQTTELPSHRIAFIDDVAATSESVVKRFATTWGSILEAHRHVPDLLPDPANISLRKARMLADRLSRPGGHTPLMPVNTGLAYLNAAMRFIHLYGEAIVGLYLAVLPAYSPANSPRYLNNALKQQAKNWCIASGEPITNVLNITVFRRHGRTRSFSQFRENPTLDDVLRVLIGSVVVCLALLKPPREDELTHLKRDCLRKDTNGYWFNFQLGKSNPKGAEAWQEEDRPIPVITAKGIRLMQRLGEGLAGILEEDRKAAGNLFYLPKPEGLGALNASEKLLNDHLDLFCDFVGLPPDSEGRRWYVRIHEMRKWFLLLLFWSGRFDVLDAARWMAGHTDASYIYAYIEKEFPGEELPQIEAQYSEERLRRLSRGESDKEDGAEALYEAVLRHFNVESLNMIPDSEWAGYVRALRESDKFHLEPHSVRGEDGSVVGINVSFVMRELP